VNHELVPPSLGSNLEPRILSDPSAGSVSGDEFRKLMLTLNSSASRRLDAGALIHFFCRETRACFPVDGVHLWRCEGASELVWEQGDGPRAERFLGRRVRAEDTKLLAESVRERRAVFSNQAPSGCVEADFGARGVLAVPLAVSGEVIGVVTFLHDSEDAVFDEDFAAKATSLVKELGHLLEARKKQTVGEEHRRAEILADVAQALHGTPDMDAIVEALADRLRLLLRTHLVSVLLKREARFEVRAVSAETPQMVHAVRSRHDRQTLHFISDLAQRALAAGEAISLSIGADPHSLGNLISPGVLIAAPLRTSRTQGAILVYPRRDAMFTAEEKALVSAIASFGAVALAHAELYSTAQAQANELHQLLEISSQLSSSGDLDCFLQAFVIHAADFLGFGRSFIALLEDNQFRIRYAADKGKPQPVETQFPEGIATRAVRAKEVFQSDEATRTPGTNLEVVTQYHVRQFLAVPLLGAGGDLLGMFGVLDKLDGPAISEEDTRRAQALSNQAAIALEGARNLHASEQHRRRAEQSNRHWIEIFDAIPDFIVVHDQAGKILRVNRSLAATIGVPPAELIGLNIRALLATGGDVSHYSCPFCRAMAEERDEFVHTIFERTFLVSTSRVHGDSDEGLQTIHVLKDITDRREAERRYRELFDNIQEGLFFSTRAGRFVEVNDAMVHMLGYASREELLQIDIPTQLYFSPQEREAYVRAIEQSGSMRNYEATFRRKDGSHIHVLVNSFGLHDDAGRLIQIRGLMLDVTGLRNYQSELHRERDFSGKILDNTQSLILVADTAGLITYANRRWQEAGMEQHDLLGRPLIELSAPAYVEVLDEALRSTLAGQQVDNLEVEIVRTGGITGKFSANLSPMRDEHGVVTCMIVVLTDITDSAVLRDKLIHAEKMAAVGQLVSGVAHEVNNPLTAILGFTDLLMENPEIPESARKDLRVILQEAQRTKQIVQNLLSFARQMPPQRAEVQLNLILRRTVQLRSYDFTNHGVEVIEHLDENLPQVMGDAHQLQQVFLNILNNAYDAVHEIGRPARIEIMSTKAGDAVEVSFRDNGNGITQPDRVFDPFFTTKEVGKGTGLGLSICYGIVKEHGGEILCHNNLGEPGATFIVRLPASSRSASFGMAAGVKQS
jgi:PAS domain S-box-containing protein